MWNLLKYFFKINDRVIVHFEKMQKYKNQSRDVTRFLKRTANVHPNKKKYFGKLLAKNV